MIPILHVWELRPRKVIYPKSPSKAGSKLGKRPGKTAYVCPGAWLTPDCLLQQMLVL